MGFRPLEINSLNKLNTCPPILPNCCSIEYRYEKELELPQLPEMVFGDNVLRVEHASGCGVELNALDALRKVDPHHDHMKVAAANEWQEAR